MSALVVDPADCADAYRELRGRVTELVRATDPATLDGLAPATPEWRVRDILAHMAGVNTDIVNGVLDGVGTDEWTAVQVETRLEMPIDEVLDEWETNGAAVEAIAPALGPAVGQWVYDACTHEHDIRNALRSPGARDSDAVTISFAWATERLGEVLDARNVPALILETEVGARHVGSGIPATTVRASCFEIVRAMTGRRSITQMDAYQWVGAPRGADLPLGIFRPRADDFVE